MPRRVAYLCLQATRQGQASYAHVHEIIAGLRARGWTIDLFEPAYAREESSPGVVGKILEFLRVQYRLWRARKQYSALYIRAHPAVLPTALWAKMAGMPVVQECNGPYDDIFDAYPWTRRLAFIIRPTMRASYTGARAVIGGTDQLGAWLRKEIGGKPFHTIPNGANTELFRPDAKSSFTFEHPYVIFFGALAPWQGVDTILEAIQDPSWPSGVHLVIAGDGMLRPEVEKAAARDTRIHYLGRVPYQEMPGLVANSIGGLSPKNYPAGVEAGLSPLKVYETLACGVPVVVTDLPGQSDLIHEHNCGLIVPMYSPTEVAAAVRWLNDNPEERARMGQRARAAVVAEHSWDRRAADTAAVLESVLSRRPRREA